MSVDRSPSESGFAVTPPSHHDSVQFLSLVCSPTLALEPVEKGTNVGVHLHPAGQPASRMGSRRHRAAHIPQRRARPGCPRPHAPFTCQPPRPEALGGRRGAARRGAPRAWMVSTMGVLAAGEAAGRPAHGFRTMPVQPMLRGPSVGQCRRWAAMADRGRQVESGWRWEPPAFESSHTNPPSSAVPPDTRAVLVVDDRHAVRTSVAAVLRSEGYKVTEATDGEDALLLLKSERFDAMVLDLRMPLIGGTLLLVAVPDPPPTVVLSATQMTYVDRAVVGEAVVAELTKPVAPQVLLDAVAAAVTGGELPQD